MKILLTGGTGFVGEQLTSRFIQEENEVTILTRSLKESGQLPKGISYLQGDPMQKGPWQEAIPGHDVIINLAGASIFSKWSEEYKKLIRDSRVFTTRNLIEGIPSKFEKEISLFSTSAVGYYGLVLKKSPHKGHDQLHRPHGKRTDERASGHCKLFS